MSFHSMDIIKGSEFTAVFYIREDDGIFIKNLNTMVDSTLELYTLKDRIKRFTLPLVKNTDETGKHYVKVTIASNITNSMEVLNKGMDDQYKNESPYYGVLTVNFTDEEPVTAFINKINILG